MLAPDQVLLLRAALLPAEPGIAAWREWRATADLDTIDRGSARLLPLLWFNLLANGIDDPWMPRFKGIYRHTWFGNQVWMRRVRHIEATLATQGVSPIALKGLALANAYYENPGLRPMDDLDLLIAPDEVARALDVLRAADWHAPFDHAERVLEFVHGVELVSPAGERLDLHGHLFQGSLNELVDAQRRARAEQLTLGDGPLRVLDATDQLLHVLVHGVESDPPAPRWLADALVMLRRRGADIEWPRLLADAAAESRSLAVARATAELRAVFGATNVPIPATVAAALSNRRWSRRARFEDRIAGGPRIFGVGFLLQRVVDYGRWRHGAAGNPARRAGFAHYLRLNWGLDSLGQLPAQVLRRGWRTMKADMARLKGRESRRSDAPSSSASTAA
jgi:hypothetical protein